MRLLLLVGHGFASLGWEDEVGPHPTDANDDDDCEGGVCVVDGDSFSFPCDDDRFTGVWLRDLLF